tara:strand:- start:39 stop:233 length:195 start_codon:yes stop_codon:yes gene_type:complete
MKTCGRGCRSRGEEARISGLTAIKGYPGLGSSPGSEKGGKGLDEAFGKAGFGLKRYNLAVVVSP